MQADLAVADGPFAVLGTGSALPGPALSTAELLCAVEPWLDAGHRALARRCAARLAITSRHLARSLLAPVEGTRADSAAPVLGARAVNDAMKVGDGPDAEVGFLVGHTATPHTPLPSTAGWIAEHVGFHGPHVEFRQACTGFAAATLFAAGRLVASRRPVALVGVETGSVFFDPRTATTDASQLVNMVQMGDGAGAVVLARGDAPGLGVIRRVYYGSDGRPRAPALWMPTGGSSDPAPRVAPSFAHAHDAVRRDGPALLRASWEAGRAAGIDPSRVRWIVPHQANGRMRELCASLFDVDPERIYCGAGELGNLGSAAMWVALDRLRRSGRLAPGDLVWLLGAEATKHQIGGLEYQHGAG